MLKLFQLNWVNTNTLQTPPILLWSLFSQQTNQLWSKCQELLQFLLAFPVEAAALRTQQIDTAINIQTALSTSCFHTLIPLCASREQWAHTRRTTGVCPKKGWHVQGVPRAGCAASPSVREKRRSINTAGRVGFHVQGGATGPSHSHFCCFTNTNSVSLRTHVYWHLNKKEGRNLLRSPAAFLSKNKTNTLPVPSNQPPCRANIQA